MVLNPVWAIPVPTTAKMSMSMNKMSMNGKLAVILHGRGLDNTAGLAVATSVQKFIRETKCFESQV